MISCGHYQNRLVVSSGAYCLIAVLGGLDGIKILAPVTARE